MNTSTLLGQVIIVLTGIIMAVAAAFFLLDQFVYPYKMADIETPVVQSADPVLDTAITGTISKVTVDEMIVSQKALVTIETTSGETKHIALPADTRGECVKKPTVTMEELQIGATVVVSGEETSNGMIEPCKSPSDDFAIKS
jgi:hypothetical protein